MRVSPKDNVQSLPVRRNLDSEIGKAETHKQQLRLLIRKLYAVFSVQIGRNTVISARIHNGDSRQRLSGLILDHTGDGLHCHRRVFSLRLFQQNLFPGQFEANPTGSENTSQDILQRHLAATERDSPGGNDRIVEDESVVRLLLDCSDAVHDTRVFQVE